MMSIAAARAMLERAIEDAKRLGPRSVNLLKGVDDIHKTVNAVRAGGYKPAEMGPLLLLVMEIHKQQEQQAARIISLISGLEKIRG